MVIHKQGCTPEMQLAQARPQTIQYHAFVGIASELFQRALTGRKLHMSGVIGG
jgi:hypothetical protein